MSTPAPELLIERQCFGGTQRSYRHASTAIGLPMRFSVFLPPPVSIQRAGGKVPALIFLADLNSNDETFMKKAGAQRLAAQLGLALVCPDSSPRASGTPGEAESWDFGLGASFYLDATEPPWATHYRMESYLTRELIELLASHLPIDTARLGLCGHSVGGHGALTLALRHPGRFKSVSALAPMCAPMHCPWGQKAFAGFLGPAHEAWAGHDASALMLDCQTAPFAQGILIDQGLSDKYLQKQLRPDIFESACRAVGQPLMLRQHAGYDHGYYFVSTFIGDHLERHAHALQGQTINRS